MEFLIEPAFWVALFSVTLVQIALGADNLILITIIANKLPVAQRAGAIRWGLILAMLFRIVLLAVVGYVLKYATATFYDLDVAPFGAKIHGALNVKSVILFVGGVFLIWKGVKELRFKAKGVSHEVKSASRFAEVLSLIVGMNLLFSVDSILTVVGMTDRLPVMIGSVLISVGLMLAFANFISDYISKNPDFEILGLFVMLLIGFVLILEGGHVAHLDVNGTAFPYIPQWIVIFFLLFMFTVDLYQNWFDKQQNPVNLHRRKS